MNWNVHCRCLELYDIIYWRCPGDVLLNIPDVPYTEYRPRRAKWQSRQRVMATLNISRQIWCAPRGAGAYRREEKCSLNGLYFFGRKIFWGIYCGMEWRPADSTMRILRRDDPAAPPSLPIFIRLPPPHSGIKAAEALMQAWNCAAVTNILLVCSMVKVSAIKHYSGIGDRIASWCREEL